jgi:mannobiose 2-epimerase
MKMSLYEEFKDHLCNKLIPFWKNLKDDEYGGFYGYMDSDLVLDKRAEKGCILNSRILWFFSNAYMTLKDESLKEYADHAYAFLTDHCLDKQNGGVFWSLDHKGEPLDTTKHTYNQAFAIYALSSYYDAFKNPEAIKLASDLFRLVENKCKDEVGYKEAQSKEFFAIENDKLSENGVMADRTMNTLLHVFEAYTEFFRVSRRNEVAERLKWILDTVGLKIFNPAKRRQEVFFDNNMESLIDLHSFGHDIETAWLVDRGTEVLGDDHYKKLMAPITNTLEAEIYDCAYYNHSLANESENGVVNEWRIWWVQAEAVVGFYNAWQKRPDEIKYREAALDIWEFIKTKLTDKRDGGEWFWRLDKDGKPDMEKPIVEPWKCPYHNGRLCIEMMKRTR